MGFERVYTQKKGCGGKVEKRVPAGLLLQKYEGTTQIAGYPAVETILKPVCWWAVATKSKLSPASLFAAIATWLEEI